MAILHLAGTPFAGWVYDVTGNYRPAFFTFLALYLLTALIVLALKVETRSKNRARKPTGGQNESAIN